MFRFSEMRQKEFQSIQYLMYHFQLTLEHLKLRLSNVFKQKVHFIIYEAYIILIVGSHFTIVAKHLTISDADSFGSQCHRLVFDARGKVFSYFIIIHIILCCILSNVVVPRKVNELVAITQVLQFLSCSQNQPFHL